MARLTLYCGPMFSGKTETLLDVLSHEASQGSPTLAFKPAFDTRHPGELVSHSGLRHAAQVLEHHKVLAANPKPHVVVVDEVQFLPNESAESLRALADAGIEIVTAGLNLDFRGETFAVVERLRELSDRVVPLRATCTRCGRSASHTQRFIDGKPASSDEPVLVLGGSEMYQPRCQDCFRLERNEMA